MLSVSEKSLTPDRNEHLRALVTELVRTDFDGNRASAARGLKVSQSYIQEFLGGSRGAGRKLLEALSDYTKRSVDDMLGRPTLERDPVQGTLGAIPGWAEAFAEAQRKYGRTIPPWAFEKGSGHPELQPALGGDCGVRPEDGGRMVPGTAR